MLQIMDHLKGEKFQFPVSLFLDEALSWTRPPWCARLAELSAPVELPFLLCPLRLSTMLKYMGHSCDNMKELTRAKPLLSGPKTHPTGPLESGVTSAAGAGDRRHPLCPAWRNLLVDSQETFSLSQDTCSLQDPHFHCRFI